MGAKANAPAAEVQSQVKAIALIATGTLATFGGLVIALPTFDFWSNVLPISSKYAALSRGVAVLISALIAYREVRHKWPEPDWNSPKIRPGGVLQVIFGGLLTLVYIALQGLAFGNWADLVNAIMYCSIVVLLSWGFIRLAKKAYDFSTANAYRAKFLSTGARQSATIEPSDTRFLKFCAIFFAAITATVTGFAALNEIIGILPPIITNTRVASSLSVLIATILVGANYTAKYLERNLARSIGDSWRKLEGQLAGRNVVESGLGPVLFGVGCLVLFLVIDTALQSKPSDDRRVEVLLIVLQISLFSSIAYGLWRLGVNEYERRKDRTA